MRHRTFWSDVKIYPSDQRHCTSVRSDGPMSSAKTNVRFKIGMVRQNEKTCKFMLITQLSIITNIAAKS
jgi:hypothetical protein